MRSANPDVELYRLQVVARHCAAEYCVRVLREKGVTFRRLHLFCRAIGEFRC